MNTIYISFFHFLFFIPLFSALVLQLSGFSALHLAYGFSLNLISPKMRKKR